MKTRSFILTAILFSTTIFPHVVYSQNITSWSANLEADAGFIENRGQFSRSSDGLDASEIQYGFDQINEDYLFTSSGVSIVLTQYSFRQKSEEEIARRAERKTQPFTLKEWQEFEREGERVVE